MKRTRKILSLILAIALIITILPLDAMPIRAASLAEETKSAEEVTARAATVAYPVTGGNIYFDPQTGTVTSCDESVTTANIPKFIEGVKVIGIGDSAFSLCVSLTSVTIPDSVTTIGDYAFYYCESLASVTIPDSVTTISDGAFYWCYSLTSITIPDRVTTIGDSAFYGCRGLNSVTIPDSVTTIGNSAFKYCSGLTSIEISNGISKIGYYVFEGCYSLESVVIPDGVTKIDGYAFSNCHELTSVKIPNSVTTIGAYAFNNCNSLISIRIPDSVTTIGDFAFSWCDSIKDVYYAGSELQWEKIDIGTNAFSDGNNSFSDIIIHYLDVQSCEHSYAGVLTKPTCEKSGYTTYTCSRCGDSYRANETVSLGHSFSNGACTRCGMQDPDGQDPDRPCNGGASCPSGKFKDVPATTNWAHEGIDYCVEHELMNGIGNGLFNPNGTVSRAQLVTILYRLEGSPTIRYRNTFSDVPNGLWYSNAIEWAAAKGVVNGIGGGKFGPDQSITREQIATILYRYEGESAVSGNLNSFPDKGNVSGFAVNGLIWATQEGLINGVLSNGVTTLSPKNNATRAQIAAIIMRYCTVVVAEKYTVTFDYNYDNKGIYTTLQVRAGQRMNVPAEPIREGYLFQGWYTERSGGEAYNFNVAISQNMTLYALWKNNTVANVMDFSEETILLTDETAEDINLSIQSIHSTEDGYVMVIKEGTRFDSLKRDDIFFLSGNENTPFGESFIGKIDHVTNANGYLSVNFVEPELDEVFDQLSFNVEDVMDLDEIEEIELVEGLSIVGKDVKSPEEATVAENLPQTKAVFDLETEIDENTFAIDGEIDLLELFKLEEESSPTPKIYWLTTDTAKKFHLPHCRYVRKRLAECESCFVTERNKYTDKEGCLVCCPVNFLEELKNEATDFSSQLKLDLSLSIDNIMANPVFEFDAEKGGIKTFQFDINADVQFESTLTSAFNGEIKTSTTEKNLVGENLKITGLKKKLLPIAYFAWSPTTNFTGGMGGDKLEFITEHSPITFAIVVYVDMDGQISYSGTVAFSYKKDLNYSIYAIKDYEACLMPENLSSEGEWDLPIAVSAKGDLNIEESISFMLYIFNINIAELAFVKVEQNASGEAALAGNYSSKDSSPIKYTIEGYMDCILSVLELSIQARMKYDLYFISGDKGISFNWTLFKRRLFEIGTRDSTEYVSEKMGVNLCTAYDENYYYYKDRNGYLVKVSKENASDVQLMYVSGFYSICAIDEGYLYLLTNNGDKYNLIRVSKGKISVDGSMYFSERLLLDNVKKVYFQDDRFIYFTDDFSKNSILKLDRNELTTSEFVSFDDEVVFLADYDGSENEQYYVVTYRYNLLDYLLGTNCNYCYIIDQNGEIIRDLGKVSSIENYCLYEYDAYIAAFDVQISDIWEDPISKNFYWVSKDWNKKVRIETDGGWHVGDAGIFALSENDSDEMQPYTLSLYEAESGTEKELMQVNDNMVFLTIEKVEVTDYDKNGNKATKDVWYLIDEDLDGDWLLYEFNEDFSEHVLVTSIPTSVSLRTANICMLDDKLYIYSAENENETVLVGTYSY